MSEEDNDNRNNGDNKDSEDKDDEFSLSEMLFLRGETPSGEKTRETQSLATSLFQASS